MLLDVLLTHGLECERDRIDGRLVGLLHELVLRDDALLLRALRAQVLVGYVAQLDEGVVFLARQLDARS